MLGKVYCILYHQPKQLCFTEFKMSDFFFFYFLKSGFRLFSFSLPLFQVLELISILKLQMRGGARILMVS